MSLHHLHVIGVCFLTCAVSQSAFGQHVGATSQGVWVPPRIDVIGPLGNRLPPSYRRTYNRPTYIGGKISHLISPTSQEAIAWKRAKEDGLYQHPPKPSTNYYFYPKPWEVLPVGPRQPSTPVQSKETILPYDEPVLDEPSQTLPAPVE